MRTAKQHFFFMASLLMVVGLFVGCADRDEDVNAAPGSTAAADEALGKAEQIMEEAGIAINFRELQGLGSLDELQQVLPSPLEIANLEDSQIDEAVSSLYSVLNELGQGVAPAAPTLQLRAEASRTDLVMVHLHIGYLYVVGSVARLERTKGDLYEIEFSVDEDTGDPNVYTFRLTDVGQQRIDAIPPAADPGEYLEVFTPEQRQAIIDALHLLAGAEIVVEAAPEFGILVEERTGIDVGVYRQDALFHLVESFNLADDLIPELEDALKELHETIGEYLAEDMIEQVKEWGFRIENEAEVRDRIQRMM